MNLDVVDRHIGRKMEEARLGQRVAVEEVAEGLALTEGQVRKYEAGTNRVTAAMLYRIATFYGVSPLFFFEGLPSPETPSDR